MRNALCLMIAKLAKVNLIFEQSRYNNLYTGIFFNIADNEDFNTVLFVSRVKIMNLSSHKYFLSVSTQCSFLTTILSKHILKKIPVTHIC